MKIKKVMGIAKDTLNFILEASKSTHPNEFVGLLQTEKEVIANVILLPGTVSSNTSAVIRLEMLPMDLYSVGSVHSHPTQNKTPSIADLRMFSKKGDYHIIACYPYDEESWACYDRSGNRRDIKVLDIKFDENEELLW